MSVASKSKPKAKTPAAPQDQNGELPEGWAEAPLDGLVYLAGRIGWRGLTAAEYTPTGPMFLSVPNLNHGDDVDFSVVNHISQERYDESPEIMLQNNDILLTKDGAGIGKLGFVKELPGPATVNSSLLVIRALEAFEPKYLFYSLKAPEFQGLAQERITGSTTPHLFQKDIKTLRVPIAPLAEQRRIVAKLESLLGKVSSSQQRLSRVPGLLKRLRQSVLAAACSGKLTADWREKNEEVVPASVLIADARFQLIEDVAELPELPTFWEWVPLGNYARCSRGRFLVRPRNDPRYFGGPYPFIQIGNLPPEGGCITSHTQTLNEKGLRVSKMFPKGTVAIAIVGATIGNSGFLGYDMCFTDSMVGLETGSEAGNRYIEFFLRHRKNDIREASYAGGGQPNIKLDTLNPYPLALPPLSEQHEIVRRVEKLFAFADQIEARLTETQSHVDRLTQSLLAKAFRGELVPTEHALAERDGREYESAAELLKRISQDQDAEAATQSTNGKDKKVAKNEDVKP